MENNLIECGTGVLDWDTYSFLDVMCVWEW